MDEIEVDVIATPETTASVLIEGLPGVGHVGKLAAEHLIEEFESTLIRRIYSEHFPPQVTIDEHGVATLACANLYTVSTDTTDLLVLVGDQQATDPKGHYRLTERFLDIANEFDIAEIMALGGVPTGELIDEYTVIGAVTDQAVSEKYRDAGVEFRENEPAGGIVGTSGLMLGLGARRAIPAVCLMGETSGYLVDPRSAQAVLEVLQTVLEFDIDFASLEERADQMESVVRQFREQQERSGGPTDEDLRYFG